MIRSKDLSGLELAVRILETATDLEEAKKSISSMRDVAAQCTAEEQARIRTLMHEPLTGCQGRVVIPTTGEKGKLSLETLSMHLKVDTLLPRSNWMK